jgi:tetratricopeptide (TPR) repeat protein
MKLSSENSEKLPASDNLLNKAEKLREKSFYLRSLPLFKKALAGFAKRGDTEKILHCLLSLGDIYRMVGRFDLAARRYTSAIEISGKLKSLLLASDARIGLALSLRAQGRWKEAVNLIRKAKKIYAVEGDEEGVAFATWAEAGALRIKGDIRGAIKTYRDAHSLFKSLKDPNGTGYCLCGLGGASRIAGLLRDSLKYYTSANKLFSLSGDKFGRAYSYCGIANAHRMLNDYDTAFTFFVKATRLYEKMGDKVSYAYTLWGIGTAHKMKGDLKKAAANMKKAMGLFRATKDLRGIVYCRLGLGEIAMLKGSKTAAERNLSSALKETARMGFAVEKCYARTLMSFFMDKTTDNKCYNQLALKLRFRGLPFNIP